MEYPKIITLENTDESFSEVLKAIDYNSLSIKLKIGKDNEKYFTIENKTLCVGDVIIFYSSTNFTIINNSN